MAVTVAQISFVVLDKDYYIVEVGSAAAAGFGPLADRLLWECFPGSEPLFKPYYDQARESGEPVEFVQFYEGTVARIRAVPMGDRLELYWERLLQLDTLTLDGLSSSTTARPTCSGARCAGSCMSSRVGREGFRGDEGCSRSGAAQHVVHRSRRQRPCHLCRR